MSTLQLLLRLPVFLGCLGAPAPLAIVLASRVQAGLAARTTAGLALYLVLQALAVVGPGAVLGLSLPHVLLGEALLLLPCCLPGVRFDCRAAVQAWHDQLHAYLLATTTPERVALAVILAAGVGAGAAMILAPSTDYDTWMYQLPQIAEWKQHGLAASQEQWQEAPNYARGIMYYPGDWTALSWLAMATVGGDVLALTPNLAGWLLLGIATAAIARSLQASRAGALAAMAMVMTLPMAGSNLDSAHVDLGQGAIDAALLSLILTVAESGCRSAGWIAVATAGLLAGTKMSGLPELGIAALLALGLRAWPRSGQRPQLGLALIAGASLALLGAWWYVRNVLITGNPTGFVASRLFHWPGVIDAAYIRSTSLLHTFHPGRPGHWRLLAETLLAYAGPLVVAGPLALACCRAWTRNRRALLVFAVLLLQIVLYLDGPWSGKHALDPDLSWWMGQQLRYTWTIWALLAALAASAGGRWASPWLFVVLALAQTAYLPWVTGCWYLAAPAAALALLAAWWWRRSFPPPRLRFARLMGGCLLALLLLTAVGTPLRSMLLDRRGWGVPRFLASHCQEGEPIAYWGSHLSWLLYGEDQTRPVLFIELGTWQHADTNPAARTIADLLLGRGARYLALGPRWMEFPSAGYRVIDDHPESFKRVLGDPPVWGMCIYRILPPPP